MPGDVALDEHAVGVRVEQLVDDAPELAGVLARRSAGVMPFDEPSKFGFAMTG